MCIIADCAIYTIMPKLCDIQNRMCMYMAGVSFDQKQLGNCGFLRINICITPNSICSNLCLLTLKT